MERIPRVEKHFREQHAGDSYFWILQNQQVRVKTTSVETDHSLPFVRRYPLPPRVVIRPTKITERRRAMVSAKANILRPNNNTVRAVPLLHIPELIESSLL